MDFLPGGDYLLRVVPWVIGVSVLFILLFLSMKIWRAVFGSKVRSIGFETGMKFQDLDTMRKKGLLSEEEYQRARHSLARHETERTANEREMARTAQLMQEVAVNPEAARKFLTDEPATAPTAGAMPRAPQPAMNNPRVVQARNAARTAPPEATTLNKPRDIDLLLEKGAITQEEYDRLRKFFE